MRGLAERPLFQYWREDGPSALLGLSVAGYPNLFLVSGPGSPIGRANAIPTIENNVDFIADLITEADGRGARTIEARDAAQSRWADTVAAIAARTLYMKTRSWYNGANIPGKPRVVAPYAGGQPAYNERCRAAAERGYEGFEFGA